MFETGVSDAPGASLTVEHFNYRVSVNAGMVVAAVQGLDAVVFTGETGEYSAAIRAGIASRMGWLGVVLDDAANRRHARLISRSESRVPVFVLPSDDELMIAQHTLTLLLNGPF